LYLINNYKETNEHTLIDRLIDWWANTRSHMPEQA